jgi:hypothetical protein
MSTKNCPQSMRAYPKAAFLGHYYICYNIRMDLVEVGSGDVDWIGLAQDRDRWRALVNSVLNV